MFTYLILQPLDLAFEDEEYYEQVLGGSEEFQAWIDIRLEELKGHMDRLEEE